MNIPTLETIAALYAAAKQRTEEPNIALERVRESMARHGYTEEQIIRHLEAGRAEVAV